MVCECRICGRKFYAKRETRMYCQQCDDELLKTTKTKNEEFKCTYDSREKIRQTNMKAIKHNMTYGQYVSSIYYIKEKYLI